MEKESQKGKEASIGAWQAESLRLTAFPTPAAEFAEPSWWKNLVGEPPEKRLSTPRTSSLQEQGPFAGGTLVLTVNPLRIDWALRPTQEETQSEPQAFLTISSFTESLARFSALIGRWFDEQMCPPLKRLALGAVLVLPVASLRQGYEQLSEYLPAVKLSIDGSSDFFYQINRPRVSKSGVHNLNINRLSRWSVFTWQAALLGIIPGAVETKISRPDFACRLELDINTAADFVGTLPDEQRGKILEELGLFALEIVQKGDIA